MNDPGYRWEISIHIEQPVGDAELVREHIQQQLGIKLGHCVYFEEQYLSFKSDHKHFFQVEADMAKLEKKMRRLSRGKPRFKFIKVETGRWTGYGDTEDVPW